MSVSTQSSSSRHHSTSSSFVDTATVQPSSAVVGRLPKQRSRPTATDESARRTRPAPLLLPQNLIQNLNHDHSPVASPTLRVRAGLKRQRSSDSDPSLSLSDGVVAACLSPTVRDDDSPNYAALPPKRRTIVAAGITEENNTTGANSVSPVPLIVNTNGGDDEECDRFIGHYRIIDPKTAGMDDKKLVARQRSSAYGASDHIYKGVFLVADSLTEERKLCQPLSHQQYSHLLRVNQRLNEAEQKWLRFRAELTADEVAEVKRSVLPLDAKVLTDTDGKRFLLTSPHHGSLHSYVQGRQTLGEEETRKLYRQVVCMTALCHSAGIVMRDLKLRKFVFAVQQRTTIRLNSIDDLTVCDDVLDDSLTERQGCPAYVSPEILDSSRKSYSGKAADVWSLGVLLFVMLLGRYPFYASTPAGLFTKIRQGTFSIPEQANISPLMRSLLCALLRREPRQRPTAAALLALPWLQSGRVDATMLLQSTHGNATTAATAGGAGGDDDQVVPDIPDDSASGTP